MSQKLMFVIGPTNSGKTRFMDYLKSTRPDEVALVQVGKILRAKYPPNYFRGLGAPEHTQREAWELMINGILTNLGKRFILVDGQPRDLKQCQDIFKQFCRNPEFSCEFWHLWAPPHVLTARALARDQGNAEALKLSLDRIITDINSLYYIVNHLMVTYASLVVGVDTSVTDPREMFDKQYPKINDFVCT